jgi:hypothetical protein
VIATPLTMMNCPTRREARAYTMTLQQRNVGPSPLAARTDYGANSGDATFSEPYTPEPNDVEDALSGLATGRFPIKHPEYTGVCFEWSEFGSRKVADGTSKTYMVGEKYMNPDHYSTGLDPSDDWSMYSGHQDDNHRVTGNPHKSANAADLWPPLRDRPGVTNRASYGSAHPSTWQVVYCDGSVHSMPYDLDMEIHWRLANMKDGEAMPGGQP